MVLIHCICHEISQQQNLIPFILLKTENWKLITTKIIFKAQNTVVVSDCCIFHEFGGMNSAMRLQKNAKCNLITGQTHA